MSFDAAWRARWGDVRPIGHELRTSLPETWVRFHSLPESKRIATTAAEYEEIIRRHLTLLRDLGADELQVVTATWDDATPPCPGAVFWRTVSTEPVPTQLFLATTTVDSDDLRALFLLVADDETADVILGPLDAGWLYHPYDGGSDVLAPDMATRDALRDSYAAWLSGHNEGL